MSKFDKKDNKLRLDMIRDIVEKDNERKIVANEELRKKKLEEQKRLSKLSQWEQYMHVQQIMEQHALGMLQPANQTAAASAGGAETVDLTDTGFQIPPFGTTIEDLGPAVWLAADNVATTGVTIDTYLDKSSNANHATPAAGTHTLSTGGENGENYASVVSGRAPVTTSLGGIVPATAFIVSKTDAFRRSLIGSAETTDFNHMWLGYDGSPGNQLYLYSGTGPSNQSTGLIVNNLPASGTLNVAALEMSHGHKTMIFNGNYSTSSAVDIVNHSYRYQETPWTPSLGSNYRLFTGEFYEMIVFDRILAMEEKDVVHKYFNNKYGLTCTLFENLTPVDTITIGGQSNAAGRVSATSLPVKYSGSQDGVYIFSNERFENLDLGQANNGSDGRWAYEMVLPYEYRADTGNDVYVVKFASGGTAIADQSLVSNWNVSQSSNAPVYYLAGQWIRTWYKALAQLQASGSKPNLLAHTWFQGEQDATTSSFSSLYENNLTNMINTIRTDMGNYQYAYWYNIELNSLNDITDQPELFTVKGIQQDVAAALQNVENVNIDGYPLQDITHLNAVGQTDLGIDLKNLIINQ